jgi:glyoxylase-like metal-dependent hydrolase (beta-lactamase superfamily II)
MADGGNRMAVVASGPSDETSAIPRPPSAIRLRSPLILALCALGCTKDLQLIQDPPDAVAATTTGPWASILTHAHRDHIAAWPLVRQARFVLGSAETPAFTGSGVYSGWAAKMGDELNTYPRPHDGELSIISIASDTAIVLGSDTLFAFPVPGHTAGSTVYLFRGILFGGDAINWRPGSGFQGARPEFSDSIELNRESLRALWSRLPPDRTRIMCTAHGKCAIADSALRERVIR